MKVLIVGNGGRESALAWKMAQSDLVTLIYITPHHPAACTLNPKIKTSNLNPEALSAEHKFELAVIGPEVALNEGMSDNLRALGIPTVGPSRAASFLECSKDFAKIVMRSAGVPTAHSEAFTEELAAIDFVRLNPNHLVVKVDGPAAGKGVVVCESTSQAETVIKNFFSGLTLGTPAERLIIEEKLTGPELSAFALCAGEKFVWLGAARDHKRLRNCNQGPNTGGMGTMSPLSDFQESEKKEIEERIFRPVLSEMIRRGTPFQGFLFAGLMRTNEGLKVLEFNVRMGDPETQVLLPLFSGDIVPLLVAAALNQIPENYKSESPKYSAVHVVMAAPGYPGTEGMNVQLGDAVDFSPYPSEDVIIFPAGITGIPGEWKTRGGRVMGVTAIGEDLETARMKAYKTVKHFSFNGCQWREDIGVSL